MAEITRKMRKGLWSPDEDEKLSRCIAMYMNGSWSDIARKAGLERCGKSCRRRWMNHLRPDLKRGRFTPAEIGRVVELHKTLGNRWSEIAGHLVGRTDNDVKNLWNTQIKRRLKSQGSSAPAEDAKVDEDDEASISEGLNGATCNTHKMDHDLVDDQIKTVAATNSSSSLKDSNVPYDQCSLPSCNLPSKPSSSIGPPREYVDGAVLTPSMSLVSAPILKSSSVFTFPFNSPPMFFADPQEEKLNDLQAMHVSNASEMFTGFPLMDPPKAVITKCISTRNHIPHALSSSNLRNVETTTTEIKSKAVYMEIPELTDCDNEMSCMQCLDVSIQKGCNLERVQDQQKCMLVVMGDQGHKEYCGLAHEMDANCGTVRESCATESVGHCSLPAYTLMYEGASCSSTESSGASTCNRTIDSRISSFPHFESRAAALMSVHEGSCKDHNRHNILVQNDQYGEVLQDVLLGGRSTSSSSATSADYNVLGSWWSSLEVPNFELPNIIDDPTCWQPLDINFV